MIPTTPWQRETDQQLRDIWRRLDQLLDRPAQPAKRDQVRLAITVRDEYGDYPTCDAPYPNTYWIVLVDASFTETAGFQAENISARQPVTAPRYLAHNVADGADAYVPLNTLVRVSRHNGQWWFYHCCSVCTASSSAGDSGSGSGSGEASSGSSSSG